MERLTDRSSCLPKREEILAFLRGRLKESRFRHTLGVEKTAVEMAALFGTDTAKASAAALLHDCAKNLSFEQLLAVCGDHGIDLSSNASYEPLLHAFAGPFEAKKAFPGLPDDVLNAIRYHTTGHPGMTDLEKIILVADTIEPGRKWFPGLEEERGLARQDLDAAVIRVLEGTIRFVEGAGQPVHPLSACTLDDLYNRQGDKTMTNENEILKSVAMVKAAWKALEDKQAEDIRILDIREVSVLADYFVIAHGRNRQHVQTLLDAVEDKMAEEGFDVQHKEGVDSYTWGLLDCGDVIVHVFSEEARLFYNLEKIWSDGKQVAPEEL